MFNASVVKGGFSRCVRCRQYSDGKQLYYYADNRNFEIPVSYGSAPSYIMSNDEAIISGEIIGELLARYANGWKLIISWHYLEYTRKNNENISVLFYKEAKSKTAYANESNVAYSFFYFCLSISSIVRLYHIALSKTVR